MMATTVAIISPLVSRRLVISLIVARSRLMSSSGTTANGMPKDSRSWE